MRRGPFRQPGSGKYAIQELEDLASPVRAFVRECCITRPELRVSIDVLYAAWEMWCQQNGRKVDTKQVFGRNLASATAGTTRRRSTNFAAFYDGISLTPETAEALDRFRKARGRAREADGD